MLDHKFIYKNIGTLELEDSNLFIYFLGSLLRRIEMEASDSIFLFVDMILLHGHMFFMSTYCAWVNSFFFFF